MSVQALNAGSSKVPTQLTITVGECMLLVTIDTRGRVQIVNAYPQDAEAGQRLIRCIARQVVALARSTQKAMQR